MVRHSGTPCILVHRAPQEEEGNKFERDKTSRGLVAVLQQRQAVEW